MPINLSGLTNDHEFYSQHYLETVIEQDLNDLAARWKEEKERSGADTPEEALAKLNRSWPMLLENAEKVAWTPSPEREAEAPESLRDLFSVFLGALGYPLAQLDLVSGETETLGLWAAVAKPGGAPWLWALDASGAGEDDPLDRYENFLSRTVFGAAEPPRWVLLLHPRQVILLDRGKWNDQRALRFDLKQILVEGRDAGTRRLMAGLLARESLCPADPNASAWLDAVEEKAHKHAYGVSEDLKYAMREVIELIGNEAIHYRREVSKKGVFDGEIDAEQLTLECLRYAYRLLFLLYLEAREELGYAPMKSEAYRTAYGLESLRERVEVPLTTERAANGFYFHQSITWLFKTIYEGVSESAQATMFALGGESVFEMPALRCHLFEPKRTPFLSHVKLRNHVWQKILRLMTLTQEAEYLPSERRRVRKGRISYKSLGINQLGAVYEALLSFRGFFAEEDLYEVRPEPKRSRRVEVDEEEGDEGEEPDSLQEEVTTTPQAQTNRDPLEQAYFVPLSALSQYREGERVYAANGEVKSYPKGTFIYRLAGRDREQSASYYTPEILAQCLVKYALKELLEGKTADEILQVTVCEPAMGSAAFLNETINQLAEAYLSRKEAELKRDGRLVPMTADVGEGERTADGRWVALDPATRQQVLQRIKMYFADQRVYGVDMNPVAVELAEVSLWLNTLCKADAEGKVHVPWFGQQLACGNSLVGARRQVFDPERLTYKKKDDASWLNIVPERVLPGASRREGSVYHFLLPDEKMAHYTDKVIKELEGERLKQIAAWRKEFLKPFSPQDIKRLQKLSDTIDRLWDDAASVQKRVRELTTDPIALWGQDAPKGDRRIMSTDEKDALYEREVMAENERFASAYSRLKLVMDYWCALWYWPIGQAELLPSRDEWLMELSYVLDGNPVAVLGEQLDLLGRSQPVQMGLELSAQLGRVDVREAIAKLPRLGLVQQLAKRHRYLHWELEFADVFADRGGFELVVGNPPWLKLEWTEAGIMADHEPLYALRPYRANDLVKLREATFASRPKLLNAYLDEYVATTSTMSFLNALQNYPLLKGTQANLYKCFLPIAWMVTSQVDGVTAFIHQEGIYEDPKGGALREALYPRLRYHFRFKNKLMLFSMITHQNHFSLNVSSNRKTASHLHMSNLFHPRTIDDSLSHVGGDPVGGIKTDAGKWNVQGHSDRIIEVTDSRLRLFAELLDGGEVPALAARFPSVHASSLLSVLEKFASAPSRIGNLRDGIAIVAHWHETSSQADGTIRRETRFVDSPSEFVLSGPHFGVALPLSKTPRAICVTSADYDVIDLANLPKTYLPRTNYVPACESSEYQHRLPVWPDTDQPVTNDYWVANREMLAQNSERTFVSALRVESEASVHTCLGLHFRDSKKMIDYLAMSHSLPLDFRVKSTGAGHANKALVARLPLIQPEGRMQAALHVRALMLNCLTRYYAGIWSEVWEPAFSLESWAKADPRLAADAFSRLSQDWTWYTPLRTDYARRQALVELDVLVAMELGLTLDELQTIYRLQFPVLRQNEADTWYDQKGRIVFTCGRGVPGVGFSRPEWNQLKDMREGTVTRTIMDDTLPGGPRERTIVYEAPFTRCDREEDYATAWAAFEARGVLTR